MIFFSGLKPKWLLNGSLCKSAGSDVFAKTRGKIALVDPFAVTATFEMLPE